MCRQLATWQIWMGERLAMTSQIAVLSGLQSLSYLKAPAAYDSVGIFLVLVRGNIFHGYSSWDILGLSIRIHELEMKNKNRP